MSKNQKSGVIKLLKVMKITISYIELSSILKTGVERSGYFYLYYAQYPGYHVAL